MVQVFGNRILGGIGAPGGGMSESFGAGVNTALDQRSARQAMAIRDQEMAWRTEDRAEAKKRRQAAEAAAAAAKARRAAVFGAAGDVAPYFRLGAAPQPAAARTALPRSMGVTEGAAPAAPARGALPRSAVGLSMGAPVAGGGGAAAPTAPATRGALPRSMGVPEGAAPTAPARGALPRSGAGLSMGAPVAGGGGAAALRGDPGGDILPAGDVVVPTAGAQPPAGVRVPMLMEEDAARAARAQAMFPTDPIDAEEEAARRAAVVEQDAQRDVRRAQQLVSDARTAEAAGRPELAEQLRAQALSLAASAARVRGVEALEGPEATGTFLTEAPTTTELDEIVVSGAAGLSFGPSVPAAPQPVGGAMAFGPALGAAGYDATQAFLNDINLQPPGQMSMADVMQRYAGPLADPLNAARMEQSRAMWVAVAQDAARQSDMGAYMAALAKVQEHEDLILLGQFTRGIQEATQFNSPQRLSAVASMLNGIDMFIAPKKGGKADIYVNGQLMAPDRDLAVIIDDMRMQLDAGYRAKQAELSAAQQEAAIKAQFDPANVTLESDANTGNIVVFDRLQQRMIGVITRTNPANPDQQLPVPTFVPTN